MHRHTKKHHEEAKRPNTDAATDAQYKTSTWVSDLKECSGLEIAAANPTTGIPAYIRLHGIHTIYLNDLLLNALIGNLPNTAYKTSIEMKTFHIAQCIKDALKHKYRHNRLINELIPLLSKFYASQQTNAVSKGILGQTRDSDPGESLFSDNNIRQTILRNPANSYEAIASKLAAIYYQNLEITKEDIIGVLMVYPRIMFLEEKEIAGIKNCLVDNNRYPLRMLLPDDPEDKLFKAALPEARQKRPAHAIPFFRRHPIPTPSPTSVSSSLSIHSSLKSHGSDLQHMKKYTIDGVDYYNDDEPIGAKNQEALKKTIIQVLNQYRTWTPCFAWVPRVFLFHHHNNRAAAVKAAIQQCDSLEDIIQILENQRKIMEHKYVKQTLPHLDLRWTESSQVVNLKEDYTTSAYYRVVMNALHTARETLSARQTLALAQPR